MVAAAESYKSEPRLRFAPEAQREGLAPELTSLRDKQFEVYIRELVQNAMDACLEQDREACVTFRFEKIEKGNVPGYKEVERALKSGLEFAEKVDMKEVVSNTSKFLERWDKNEFPVMYVTDNGNGFNEKRMEAVLSKGTPLKTSSSSGSKGVGHITAFALSNLHYIFYAGSYYEGGKHNQIGAGHVLLLSHPNPDDKERMNDMNGYFVSDYEPGCLLRFPEFLEGSNIPEFLRKNLPEDDTGSVVAILGFQAVDKDQDLEEVSEIIERLEKAVIENFLVAVFEGKLRVKIVFPTEEKEISKESLQDVFNNYREMNEDAVFYEALFELLKNKERAIKEDNLDSKYRNCKILLLSDEGSQLGDSYKVSVWRNGMLISKTDSIGQKRHYMEQEPFTAVVLVQEEKVDSDKKLVDVHDLIRKAESAHHDKIVANSKELSPKERKHVSDWRAAVIKWLQEHAEKCDYEAVILPFLSLKSDGPIYAIRTEPSDVDPVPPGTGVPPNPGPGTPLILESPLILPCPCPP